MKSNILKKAMLMALSTAVAAIMVIASISANATGKYDITEIYSDKNGEAACTLNENQIATLDNDAVQGDVTKITSTVGQNTKNGFTVWASSKIELPSGKVPDGKPYIVIGAKFKTENNFSRVTLRNGSASILGYNAGYTASKYNTLGGWNTLWIVYDVASEATAMQGKNSAYGDAMVTINGKQVYGDGFQSSLRKKVTEISDMQEIYLEFAEVQNSPASTTVYFDDIQMYLAGDKEAYEAILNGQYPEPTPTPIPTATPVPTATPTPTLAPTPIPVDDVVLINDSTGGEYLGHEKSIEITTKYDGDKPYTQTSVDHIKRYEEIKATTPVTDVNPLCGAYQLYDMTQDIWDSVPASKYRYIVYGARVKSDDITYSSILAHRADSNNAIRNVNNLFSAGLTSLNNKGWVTGEWNNVYVVYDRLKAETNEPDSITYYTNGIRFTQGDSKVVFDIQNNASLGFGLSKWVNSEAPAGSSTISWSDVVLYFTANEPNFADKAMLKDISYDEKESEITIEYTSSVKADLVSKNDFMINDEKINESDITVSVEGAKIKVKLDNLLNGKVYNFKADSSNWKTIINTEVEAAELLFETAGKVIVEDAGIFKGSSKLTSIANGKITGKATNIVNTTNEEQTVTAILVLMRDGVIVNRAYKSQTISAGDTINELSTDIDVPDDGKYSVKFLVWDTAENGIGYIKHINLN